MSLVFTKTVEKTPSLNANHPDIDLVDEFMNELEDQISKRMDSGEVADE